MMASWFTLPLLPKVLRIFTWNIRGVGALKQRGEDSYKLLADFRSLGPYDIVLLQEPNFCRLILISSASGWGC